MRARIEGGSPPTPMRAWVEPVGGAPRLRADVGRERIEAYAGETTFLGARIFLGGEDVSAWLDGGMRLLIDLHQWAEANDAALNGRIWAFLAEHTERHAFPI